MEAMCKIFPLLCESFQDKFWVHSKDGYGANNIALFVDKETVR